MSSPKCVGAETINSGNCVSLSSSLWRKGRYSRGFTLHVRAGSRSSVPRIHKHWLLFSWIGITSANHQSLQSTVSGDRDIQASLHASVCVHAMARKRAEASGSGFDLDVGFGVTAELTPSKAASFVKKGPHSVCQREVAGSWLDVAPGRRFGVVWQSVDVLTHGSLMSSRNPCVFFFVVLST